MSKEEALGLDTSTSVVSKPYLLNIKEIFSLPK